MKKIFTFCVLLVMGCLSIHAQSFSFVDGDGNIIENGSTLTMDEVDYKEDFTFNPDGSYEIIQVPVIPLKDVYVKNMSSKKANCKITFDVTTLPSGTSFDACCAGNCTSAQSVGSMEKNTSATAGSTIDISSQTEWICGTEPGTCVVKLSVKGENSMTTDSEITVNFVYDGTTGITGVQNNASHKVVARYSIDGQLLNAPQKGINILKYADGRTEKVIVK